MFPVRYIHAADLHLDVAFRGIRRINADVAATLRASTFIALERLITLCEREKPDFLVIAGDIYNQEDYSLKAQMALRDGCERLAAHGIRVFLAHGNHDALSSRLQTLHWPSNTTIFGSDMPEAYIVTRDHAPIAVVHGISHASARESRNVAQAFSRLAMGTDKHDDPDNPRQCLQLGVLHCTLENVPHSDRYAPCTVQDLQNTGLDAWALGHVHEQCIVAQSPFVAYSGNIQGLHINETGPRGCLLVQAMPCQHAQTFAFTTHFHPLGPVVWENITVNIEGSIHLDAVEARIMDALESTVAAADVSCHMLLIRVNITGRTELDGLLRQPASLEDMAERLQEHQTHSLNVWIKDIVLHTQPLLDMHSLCAREDLLGEIVRFAQIHMENPDMLTVLQETAFQPLTKHPRARKAITPPDNATLLALLNEAQCLCIDCMEAQ